MQERVQLLEQKNKGLSDDVIVQKIQIRQLEDDLNKAKGEKEQVRFSYQSKIEVMDRIHPASVLRLTFISHVRR